MLLELTRRREVWLGAQSRGCRSVASSFISTAAVPSDLVELCALYALCAVYRGDMDRDGDVSFISEERLYEWLKNSGKQAEKRRKFITTGGDELTFRGLADEGEAASKPCLP